MRHLAFVLIFLAYYFPVPLPLSGGWYLPNLPALILGILAFFLAPQHLARTVLVLSVVACYCIINGLFAISIVTSPIERLKGSFQLLYYIGLAMVISSSNLFLDPVNRRVVGWMFLSLGSAMVCGGYLEDKTSIGAISDRFRDFFYGGGSAYLNDQRDLILSSGIRPKFFASEPAAAALGTCLCFTLGAACLMQFTPLLIGAIGCLLTAKVYGSPIPVAFAVTLLAGGFPCWGHLQSPGSQSKVIFKQVIALIAGAFLILLAFTFIDTLRIRFAMALDGTDRSSYLRLWHLLFVAADAMKINPLFGAGIGGEMEVADSLFVEGYENAKGNTLLNNPIWTIPLFGGIVGTLFAVLAFGKILIMLPLYQRVLFGLFVGSVMLSGASIVNTPAWITGAVMFAILRGFATGDLNPDRKSSPVNPPGEVPLGMEARI